MTWAELVGWIAGGITLASGLPQAVRLVRTHDTEGVSRWGYVLWFLVAVWWCVWGLQVGARPTAIVNAACVPVLGTCVTQLRPNHLQRLAVIVGSTLAVAAALVGPQVTVAVGTMLLLVYSVPSVVAVLRPGADLSGVSPATWLLVIAANVAWVIYNFGIDQARAATGSAVGGILAVVVVWRCLAYRRTIRPDTDLELDATR